MLAGVSLMSFEIWLTIVLGVFPFGWEMFDLPHLPVVGVLCWALCLGLGAHLVLKSKWFLAKFDKFPRVTSAMLGSLATFTLIGVIGVGWWLASGKSRPGEKIVTISAYQPIFPAPMIVIKDQQFEDQDVPLDGYVYDHSTFKNVCLRYEGGAYQLQNVTLKSGGKVCVQDQRLKNLMALMNGIKLVSDGSSYTENSPAVRQR
jgi:hypothetical protein